ncbi:MAG: hypothetical protein RJA70_2147 [Pseudomonadota bacterium]|jgi:hephaestin
MHSINGYVFGNLPGLTMKRGERTRWYVMGMGTEVDLHTPHFHANTVTLNGARMDVLSILPATMVTVDMITDNPGTWLYHCHVNDHILAGMLATYKVTR